MMVNKDLGTLGNHRRSDSKLEEERVDGKEPLKMLIELPLTHFSLHSTPPRSPFFSCVSVIKI